MFKIEEVAQLAKKHNLHSGNVKWPDDELENLYNFLQEALKIKEEKATKSL